jgi:hypothetical protein
MNLKELRKYLNNVRQRIRRKQLDLGDFDGTDEGVDAMHALIRLYGLRFVSDKAPKDWAWILVGDVGLGYSGTTPTLVKKYMRERGWMK